LFKIQKFLAEGLRLRTACDLEPLAGVVVKRPEGFALPDLKQLEAEMPALVKAASSSFADPAVTEVTYEKLSS
jgi:CRISPR-associated protein Csb1